MKTTQSFGTAMPDHDAVSKKRIQKLILMVFAFSLFSATVFGQSTPPSLAVSDLTSYNTNGGSAVAIAPTLTITDPDLVGMSAATVYIDSNYAGGQDYLLFTSINGITGAYDGGKGILYLTGTASASDYQAALRSVKFSTTATDANRRRFSITLGGALYNSANGHYYLPKNGSNLHSFSDFTNAAQATSLFGWQGYLVTVTSSQENNYIQSLSPYSLLGATDHDVEGVWRWKTGPEGLEDGGQGRYFSTQSLRPGSCSAFTGTGVSGNYVGWGNGEPNDCSRNEDYAQLNGGTSWNDMCCADGNDYVIEYGGFAGETPLNIYGAARMDLIVVPSPTSDVAISKSDIMEGNATGDLIGSFATTSSDPAATFTYTFVSGAGSADNGAFTIVGADLKASQVYAYNTQSQFQVRIMSTDNNGNTFEKPFTITIDPVPPVVNNITVSMNENDNYYFGEWQYDNAFVSSGGWLQQIQILSLPTVGELDLYGSPVNVGDYIYVWDIDGGLIYNSPASYSGVASFQWIGIDGNGVNSSDTAYTYISINNHAPTDVTITATDINELQAVGTAVGFLSSTDIDVNDIFTYTLVPGVGDDDNASFSILLNKLQAAVSFDYITKNVYHIRVATTDISGASYEKPIDINIKHLVATITDIDELVQSGHSHDFAAAEFESAFSIPDAIGIGKVRIVSLPAYGELDYLGNPVNAGDEIAQADLGYLSYMAPGNFSGPVSFDWIAVDAINFDAASSAKVNINVKRFRSGLFGYDTLAISILNTEPAGSGIGRLVASIHMDSLAVGGTGVGSGATRDTLPTDGNTLGSAHKTDGISEDASTTFTNNCFPNPFVQSIAIQYQLPMDAKVSLKVYNVMGMEVANLVDTQQPAGDYTIQWNGKSQMGLPIETGNYFYKIILLDANGKQIATANGRMVKL